jgi:hypothetical protein
MKNKSKIFLATILFCSIATSPLWAQTNAENGTNNTTAALAPPPFPAQPSIDINDSGVHVGDPGPVDVRIPGRPPRDFGILVPLSPFIMPVAILIVIFYFKHRRQKMMHETLRVMIEKGVPVTPELIASLKGKEDQDKNATREKQRTVYLLTGLILSGVGIGVMAIAGKPGLIPLLVGAAFFIVWLVEKENKNDVQPPKQ